MVACLTMPASADGGPAQHNVGSLGGGTHIYDGASSFTVELVLYPGGSFDIEITAETDGGGTHIYDSIGALASEYVQIAVRSAVWPVWD